MSGDPGGAVPIVPFLGCTPKKSSKEPAPGSRRPERGIVGSSATSLGARAPWWKSVSAGRRSARGGGTRAPDRQAFAGGAAGADAVPALAIVEPQIIGAAAVALEAEDRAFDVGEGDDQPVAFGGGLPGHARPQPP